MQRRERESRELERERASGTVFGFPDPRASPPFCSSSFFPFFWLNNIIQLIPGLVLVSGLAKLKLKRTTTNISV